MDDAAEPKTAAYAPFPDPQTDEQRAANMDAYSAWGREQDAARAARGTWTVEQMNLMDELVRNSRLLVEQMRQLLQNPPS
jgi:hypothetical protein